MIHRVLFPLIVVAVLFLPGSEATEKTANVSEKQLTPKNVNTQPLRFVIHAEKINALLRFVVSVQGKAMKAPPDVEAYLLLADEKKQVASCAVAASKQTQKVTYEFLVSKNHLERSRFLLEETELVQQMQPGSKRYWFYLKDFAKPKTSQTSLLPELID